MIIKFDAVDGFVIILILSISVLIGVFHGFGFKLKILLRYIFKKQSNDLKITVPKYGQVSEYLTANSSMRALPIAFSLIGTFFSATSLIGLPAEVYIYGVEHWTIAFGFALLPFVTAYITGPFFMRIKVMSVIEYLMLRFNSKKVRTVGIISYIIRSSISSAIFIYGPASTFYSLTNINEQTAILIIGLIGTFYTTIGGIKAVVWTDFFQVIIMFFGLTIIICKGIFDISGISNLWEICLYGGRLNFFDFNPDPFVRQSSFSLFFGIIIFFFYPLCVDQPMLQRFIAAKSIKTAQNALLLSIPFSFLIQTLCCFTGLVIYANYFYCDPLASKNIKNANEFVGYFVNNNLKMIPGMSGLFLGSLICGSLSSLSSILNSKVSIIWNDFLKPINYFKNFDDKLSLRTNKLLVIIIGFLDTGLAFIISNFGLGLQQISFSLNGAFVAPTLGLFILGSFFKCTNSKGAISGTIAGYAFGIWITLMTYFKKPFYQKLPISTEFCENNNFSSIYIFENYYKEKMILQNKINGSYYAMSSRASNLQGLDIIYSFSYMWYTAFGFILTILVGLAVSLGTKKENDVNDDFILFDLACFFSRKKNKIDINH